MYYRSIGWSPFPVGSNKKPLIEWAKYQMEIASEAQIHDWKREFNISGIGIATGKVSGIVVVDVEKGGGTKDLPPTVCSRTGGGGYHFFYKYPNVLVKNSVRIRDKTDVRGDGGYVVVPPSLHKSGNRYEWVVSPADADLAECPQWVLEKSAADKVKTDWNQFFSTENSEGTRNQQAASLTGKILFHVPIEMWDVVGLPALQEWNSTRNKPPLEEKELMATWESIKKAELERRTKRDKQKPSQENRRTQSETLMELIEDRKEEIVLFHNELREPYVQMTIGSHKEIWSCRSKMLKRWLAKLYWENLGKAINSENLNATINIIESAACFNGAQHSLHNRVAWHEESIWYDLADAESRAVKITPQGWEIITCPPILFRRYSHQQAQVEPVRGGDAKAFLKFVNVQDEDQKILLLVWMVSCFIPDFPHPMPNFYGAQGSAKSLLSKLLRKITDPSALEAMSFPKDVKEFAQLLAHHHCIFFDNVSYLPNDISDALCKAITGDGFSKRELYTDEDDIIFRFQAMYRYQRHQHCCEESRSP